MHVLFVAPHFPAGQREFVRALHSVGARVTGIGEADPRQLGDRLRGWLHGYEQVPSVCDEEAMLRAVRRVQQREWVDRLEATIEAPESAVFDAMLAAETLVGRGGNTLYAIPHDRLKTLLTGG